jgi:hypothetical protein
VLARGYYKGGFESKMNRKEASLILEMQYVISNFPLHRFLVHLLYSFCLLPFSSVAFQMLGVGERKEKMIKGVFFTLRR